MFEKRKNSETRTGLSFGLALLLLLGGIFAGLNLGNFAQSEPEEAMKPPQVDFAIGDLDIDLSGEWIGTITEDYGIESRYDFRLKLDQDGDVVTGMSYLDMADEPEIYSESPIEGIIQGDQFTFSQVSTTVLENVSMDYWCLADLTVTYQILNGQETLVGTWDLADHERLECGDISGRVILTRQPE
jgi:hypothetical protein